MLVFIGKKKRFTSLCHQLSFSLGGYSFFNIFTEYLSLPFPQTTFLSNLFAHFSGSQPGCALNGLVSFLEILVSNPISPWWEVGSSKLCILEKYPGA